MISRVLRSLPMYVLLPMLLPAQTEFTADEIAVKRTLERATNAFANYRMYGDVNKYIGMTVEFRGGVRQKPVVIPEKRDYLQISGNNNEGEYINVVAFVDAPLPTGRDYNAMTASGTLIVPDKQYRFVGIVGTCRDFVDRTGQVLFLPTFDLLLVYEADDQGYERPIWLSRTLRRGQ